MDEITEIINFSEKDHRDVINSLKEKSIDVPDWGTLKKEYDPKEHDLIARLFVQIKLGTEGLSRFLVFL